MKQKPSPTRCAAAMLLVAAVLPFTPGLAQDVASPPVVNVPPLTITPPAASPAPAAPTMGAPVAVRGPVVEHVAAPGAAPAATRTARAAPAHTTASTRTASAHTSTPARSAAAPPPATAPAPAAPTADTNAPVTAGAAPILAVPPAAPAPQPVAATAPAQDTPIAWWPFVAGLAILVIGAAVLIARRRRRAEEEAVYYEEPAYAEPVAEAPLVMPAEYQQPIVAPVYAAPADPVTAPAEQSTEMEIAASDPADIEALAATAAPHPGRPWLEFLMRPVRAGADGDEARVEFELTVGNTGAVQARDVRVSTWMVASGDGTDMESALIEPPAGAAHRDMSIAPGEGAMVEGAIVMPRDDNSPVLPVVVADARYRLPDGSEGRTSASFAIGRPGADGIRPLRAGSGVTEDVEAELQGEPERV